MIVHIKNTLAALGVCVLVLGLGSLLDNAQTEAARSLITLLLLMLASVMCVVAVLAAYIKHNIDEVQP